MAEGGTRTVLLSVLLSVLSLVACAAGAAEIVATDSRHCQHGLVEHEGGDFSVFLFCDDALGSQIGIIYTKPGVGPVERDSEWSSVNRFWQEGSGMTDVTQLLWSKSGNYLYVVTGVAYGDNSLYELDLRHRKSRALMSGTSGQIRMKLTGDRELSVDGKKFRIGD